MQIAVLNGSPKGEESVTMQYVKYMRQVHPDLALSFHNVSQRIKAIEKSPQEMQAVLDDVKSADLVLWAFPLYYFLVPAQYKRFIELVFEGKGASAFKSKFAAVLTTSLHFFDHTAHNYMRAICDDLGMKFAGAFSASMYDLVRSEERSRFGEFAGVMLNAVANDLPASRAYPPVARGRFAYRPSRPKAKSDAAGKTVLIMTDHESASSNLGKMVDVLHASFAGAPEPVNIRDLDIKGGCLGCVQCAYDNTCVYGDTDVHHEFFETRVKKADIIFYCFETRDRYCSAAWKTFFDRSFYNNHTPALKGKQIGFLVSGPLSGLSSLREFIQAFPEFQQSNLVDIVTDEGGDSKTIDAAIRNMARSAVALAGRGYAAPRTFYSVGGWKIFRDEIWAWLRFPFIADDRYYKKHGLYDFPKRKPGQRAVNGFITMLVKIMPGFRKIVYKKFMKSGMIKPFGKIVKE
jgi:multimeric flavodoxin WrbA